MVNTVLSSPTILEEIKNNPERYPNLTKAQRDLLADIGHRVTVLLEPLARITSADALENALKNAEVPYTKLILELLDIISTQNLVELLKHAAEEPEALAAKKADLLGPESLQQFLGALRSLIAISEWALKKYEQGGAAASQVQTMDSVVEPMVLRAGISLIALLLVLTESIQNWQLEAIYLLCAAADTYMTQVEDVFDSLISVDLSNEEMVEH